jgi:multiple sugar transport system permease protein
MKRKSFSSLFSGADNKEQIAGIMFLLPFGIFFILFTVLPVLSSAVLSFFNYDMLTAPKWVGVNNFLRMILTDDVFKISVKNTLVFAIVTGPLGFALSFLLAWIVNEFNSTTRSILSFLFYSPALVGNVYFVWTILFSGDSYGYLNSILLQIGFITEPVQWLKDADYTLVICIVVQLWMCMGTSFLANIAGLQNASPQLYEAGAIDGVRNRWQELWYITLPSMKSMLLFSSVMQIQSAFSAGAVMTTLTGNPSVEYSTHTIVTHLTDVGTVRYEMGYASAISVFLFLLMALSRWLIGKLISKTGK